MAQAGSERQGLHTRQTRVEQAVTATVLSLRVLKTLFTFLEQAAVLCDVQEGDKEALEEEDIVAHQKSCCQQVTTGCSHDADSREHCEKYICQQQCHRQVSGVVEHSLQASLSPGGQSEDILSSPCCCVSTDSC